MKNRTRLWLLLLALGMLGAVPSIGQQTEPSWPQQFQVFQGEPTSFGFAVTQPGPITVSVLTQGQPVTVMLTGPLPQPVQQTGSGSFVLTYNATAMDVQKSALWVVELTAAGGASAPMPRLPIALAPTRAVAPVAVAPGAVATGSITVQHPAVNLQVAQTQFQQNANASQLQAQQILLRPVADTLAPIQTAYVQQLATRQAAQKQALLTQINVSKPIVMATRQGPLVPTGIVSTGATSSADTGAGSSGIQTVAGPAIASLSVTQGQPGDTVLFSGSGFGTNPEVHFLVNPGMDMIAKIEPQFSTDSQILAYVPDASGILAYSGVAYVKAGNQKSNLVSFQFNPAIDYAQLVPSPDGPDVNIDKTDLKPLGPYVWHDGGYDLFGHRANDYFYLTLLLKNGWSVDHVNLDLTDANGADAYVTDSRVGTNSPYVKVHWWTNCGSAVVYRVLVTIKGPKGVPYQ